MRASNIPLPDIMRKYLKEDTFNRDGNTNRYKTHCPFHADSSPSMILYDKTEEGVGWDYHCYVCGAHGTAVTMLVGRNIAENEDVAEAMILSDFGRALPEKVNLKTLCDFKGLDYDFAKKQGWKDCNEGVEIPFLDRNGDPLFYKIRKKFYGKDKYYYKKESDTIRVHTTPFGLHWLDAYDSDVVYITEGETDCMTLRQAGYPAIGIAGTNGFQEAFAPYISRFETIVVMRDNDAAGWRLVKDIAEVFPDKLYIKELPKGTKDINNFHLNKCGSNIKAFQAMFDTLALLPASPDTFITAVKTGELAPTETACWDMVMQSLTTKAERLYYKDMFCKETKTSKSVVTACMAAASKPVNEVVQDEREFIVIDNCYYKEVWRGDAKVQERISNFVLDPQYDIQTDTEIIRVCDMTNITGKTVHNVRFDAECLSAASKFNARCLAAGDYIFTGTQEDLFQICFTIFNVPKRVVHSPKRIGRLDSGGWLFANCGIDSKGELVEMEDGLVLLDGVAYTPRAISIDDGTESGVSDMPEFDLARLPDVQDGAYLNETAEMFERTFGNPSALLGLGWVAAGWYSDAIFNHFGFYPYLFVTGKRSSGKSVYCSLLQCAYGFSAANAGMSIETPSNVGISRYLSYRASLPQWYDDYRNDVKRITMKDGLLLDVYNRHGAVKGVKTGGEVRKEQVNGFLLLSGEDTPANNALLTRCVTVTLSSYERDAAAFPRAADLMSLLPLAGLSWARAATRGEHAELIKVIEEMKELIYGRNGDIRYAANHAIFLGAFIHAFGAAVGKRTVDRLVEHVCNFCQTEAREVASDHAMSQFLRAIPDLALKGLVIPGQDFKVEYNPKRLLLRTVSVHRVWGESLHGAPISARVLRDYLKHEPFFIREDRATFDAAGRQRCDVLLLHKMEAEFDDLIGYLETFDDKPSY
jgi:5S rRNA maturation endonuclease (ribonuclease M5)